MKRQAHPRSATRFPLKGACLRTGKAGSAASRWGGNRCGWRGNAMEH